jgi:hypothetical protein
MAHKYGVLDDLLHFVSASRSRSAVMLAAVSFAIFHLAVMATAPGPAAADVDAEIPRQLMHFAAVICRFVLPLGFMLAGITAHARAAASNPGRN